jgi:acyl-CoA synthetase (AMP-forming)/AMP-acid ligase II
VAPYKRLRAIEEIDELPRSHTGKLLRRVLVERERRAVGQSVRGLRSGVRLGGSRSR